MFIYNDTPQKTFGKVFFIKIDQLSEDVSIIFTNNVLVFFSFRNNLEGVYEIISFCGGGGAYIIRWTIQLHIFIFVLFE